MGRDFSKVLLLPNVNVNKCEYENPGGLCEFRNSTGKLTASYNDLITEFTDLYSVVSTWNESDSIVIISAAVLFQNV